MSTLILASASPRRRDLIGKLGLPVIIRPANIDEEGIEARFRDPARSAGELTQLAPLLAEMKARAIMDALLEEGQVDPSVIIIGADTTVLFANDVLGKPRDAAQARAMLTRLRGQTHTVVTGLATGIPVPGGRVLTRAVATPVTMRSFSDEEMLAYIASGDPFDKAGSYAVQHPQFQPVERIAGCATSVIGLPLCALSEMLTELGAAVARPPRPASQQCPWDTRCGRVTPTN